jgi:glycosyltransferase involved in cell wall biosynthesis
LNRYDRYFEVTAHDYRATSPLHQQSKTEVKMTVCLVTEELSGIGISGGIGTAFRELANLLKAHYELHIIYVPVAKISEEAIQREIHKFRNSGVHLHIIDPCDYGYNHETAEARSYAVYRFLRDCDLKFDIVHFHDYKGLGYYPLMARSLGIMLKSASVVMQCHGPSAWTIAANKKMFSDPAELVVDFMEKKSIEWADYVVSPSKYLKDFMQQHGFKLPQGNNVRIIKNICAPVHGISHTEGNNGALNEIVFFGRHEDRKGLDIFCRAVDQVADELADRGVQVTFLGRLGEVRGEPSGLFVSKYASHWRTHVKFLTGLDRDGSLRYLAQSASQLVVIASEAENSPYTVAEAILLRKPLICSPKGGGSELIDEAFHADVLCLMEPEPLAKKILGAVREGANPVLSSQTCDAVQQDWLQLHKEIKGSSGRRSVAVETCSHPKVVLGISHYERPEKMHDAVMSALRQTYRNLEIVVVDDCSRSHAAASALDAIEGLLSRSGGRVIRRSSNGYLGAARNSIIAQTESDYIIFLDDDDLALPNLVEELVDAAVYSNADIVNCFNLYLDVRQRDVYRSRPESYPKKVSYFPVGGPISVAPVRNTLGAATALIRRSALERLGGYSEIYGVGHEDYELYVRALQEGMKIAVLPEPLYLYETGRPSMLSMTSAISNFHRVYNSISFYENGDAWKDLIGVFAGQVAKSQSRGPGLSDTPDGLISELYASQFVDPCKHMSKLAEWADRRGYPQLAIAWLDAVETYNRNNLVSYIPQGDSSSAKVIKFDLLDQALALEYAPAKVDWLVRFVSEYPDGEVLRRIRSHLESCGSGEMRSRLSANLCALMPSLLNQSSTKSSFLSQLVSFFAENNLHSEANVVFNDLLIREERAYIERYDDLYKVFGTKSDLSGVRHYLQYGRFEERFGFEHIWRLSYLVVNREDELGLSEIEKVMKNFGVKFRATAPKGSLLSNEDFSVLEKVLGFLQGRVTSITPSYKHRVQPDKTQDRVAAPPPGSP